MLRRARQLLRDEQAALDAMQEVFVRAIRAGAEFRADASPMTWLHRITTNYCLNWLRDNTRRGELLERQRPADESRSVAVEDRHAVLELLAQLPADVGAVAIYYHVDELKQEEIAELLGVSRRYVRERLDAFRALSQALLPREVPT